MLVLDELSNKNYRLEMTALAWVKTNK